MFPGVCKAIHIENSLSSSDSNLSRKEERISGASNSRPIPIFRNRRIESIRLMNQVYCSSRWTVFGELGQSWNASGAYRDLIIGTP